MTAGPTLAARIVTDTAPKRVLVIGEIQNDVAAALHAVAADVSRADAERIRVGEHYDLAIWYGAPALFDDARRRTIGTICAVADDVVLDVDPARAAADWIERFAEHRFFVDADV